MPLHDVTRFSMADMAICSSALRRSGQDASSMEQAAENIVEYLYTHLSGGLGGAESLALVRLFKTQPYGELEEDLQNFARRLLGHSNISTTQHYMPLDDQVLADAQDFVD